MQLRLTLCQRDGDDNAIASSDPQTVTRHHQSRDSDKWEAQFARAWNTDKTFISAFSKHAAVVKTDDCRTDPTFCWHRARCRHPGGAGRCERGTAWGWSRVWWTPRYRRRPRPADVPDCPYEGGHQMISAVYKDISSLDMKQREDFRSANHYHEVTVPLSSWL